MFGAVLVTKAREAKMVTFDWAMKMDNYYIIEETRDVDDVVTIARRIITKALNI